MTELPEPACTSGYSLPQVYEIMGDREPEFRKWMNGQTMSLCDGRRYNRKTKEYESSECADTPHGVVIYSCDVRQFLADREPLD